MKEAVIAVCVTVLLILGYFLMKGFDRFLDKNCKTEKGENNASEPDCVIIDCNMPDDEIMKEIRRFRKSHKDAKIILSEDADT